MNVSFAVPVDAPDMAAAHAQAFDKPWDETNFEDLLDGEGIFGVVARDPGPAGVLICRAVAGEAEILTVGVATPSRRRGIGRALMEMAISRARAMQAQEMFLEVDVASSGAVALYTGLGFVQTGLRRGYYDRGAAGLADALVMRLDLTKPPN